MKEHPYGRRCPFRSRLSFDTSTQQSNYSIRNAPVGEAGAVCGSLIVHDLGCFYSTIKKTLPAETRRV